MTEELFKKLINSPESKTLDFKREFYDFEHKNTPDKKTKKEKQKKTEASFIKDILAFANTIERNEKAYIIFGFDSESKKNVNPFENISFIDDAILQEKIKDKVDPVPDFLFEIFTYNKIEQGIITIPCQSYSRPSVSKSNMPGLDKNTIYIRRGSSNQEATSEEEYRIREYFQTQSDKSQAQKTYLKRLTNLKLCSIDKELDRVLEKGLVKLERKAKEFKEQEEIEAFWSEEKEEQEIIYNSIEERFENEESFIIIGPAMSGKTVFIKQKIGKMVNALEQGNNKTKIPILLECSEYTPNNHFKKMLKHPDLKNWADEALQEGKCTIFVDALNDIPEDHRPDAIKELQALMNTYHRATFIFTEREYGFEPPFELPVLKVLPLDDSQIICFVDYYFPDERENVLQAMDKAISELNETPFLLKLFLIAFKKSKNSLPINKGKLYDFVLKYIFKWEDKRNNPGSLRLLEELKKSTLSFIAFDLQKEGLPQKKAPDILKIIEDTSKTRSRVKKKKEDILTELLQSSILAGDYHENHNALISFSKTGYKDFYCGCFLSNYFKNNHEFPLDDMNIHWMEAVEICLELLRKELPTEQFLKWLGMILESPTDMIKDSLIPFIQSLLHNKQLREDKSFVETVKEQLLSSFEKNELPLDLRKKLGINEVVKRDNYCLIKTITYDNKRYKGEAIDKETGIIYPFSSSNNWYNCLIKEDSLFYYKLLDRNNPDKGIYLEPILSQVAKNLSHRTKSIIRFCKEQGIALNNSPITPINKKTYRLIEDKIDSWHQKAVIHKNRIKAANNNLIMAAKSGNSGLLLKSIEDGADCNFYDIYGFTPLMYAIRNKHFPIFKLLLSNKQIKLELTARNGKGMSALMYAAQRKNFNMVRMLIEKGAAVDSGSTGVNNNNSALLIASWEGNLKIVEYLIEKGADINQVDSHGFTALIKAARRGKVAVIKYLIHKNADPLIKDKEKRDPGKSAGDWATKENHDEIVTLLKEYEEKWRP